MMNVPCKIGFMCFAITSFTGAWLVLPLASASRYTWLSCSVIRIHKPTSTSTNEAMNGMRQPHFTSSSWPTDELIRKNTPLAMNRPMGAPNWGKVPNQARLPSGAFSVATNAAPPHSPPKPKPWPKRNRHSSSGARMPICS